MRARKRAKTQKGAKVTKVEKEEKTETTRKGTVKKQVGQASVTATEKQKDAVSAVERALNAVTEKKPKKKSTRKWRKAVIDTDVDISKYIDSLDKLMVYPLATILSSLFKSLSMSLSLCLSLCLSLSISVSLSLCLSEAQK